MNRNENKTVLSPILCSKHKLGCILYGLKATSLFTNGMAEYII